MFKFHSFSVLAIGCVACGASFTAGGGSGGSVGSGTAGEASGGPTSSAGSSSGGDAGETEVGGASSAGQASISGASGSLAGAGGLLVGAGGSLVGAGGWGSGRGGWGNGGWRSGNAGAAPSADCATLKQDYQTAVEKARVCDKGSTDQCTPSSVAQPVGGCGCPVLLNAKSEYTTAAKKAYQAYQDAKCDAGAVVCDIFCVPAMSASCASQNTASGSTFVCTSGAVQN